MGNDVQQIYRNPQITLEMLSQITLMGRGEIDRLEKISVILQAKDATPLGLSKQYQA